LGGKGREESREKRENAVALPSLFSLLSSLFFWE
jgi:hypothetical protein